MKSLNHLLYCDIAPLLKQGCELVLTVNDEGKFRVRLNRFFDHLEGQGIYLDEALQDMLSQE